MNALKLVGKDKGDIRITFVGSGAAGVACSRLIFAWGVDPAKATMVDVRGILGKHRHDFPENSPQNLLCQITNQEEREGGIEAALQGADVVISYSQPGPGVILSDWIRGMAADPIVFACANPVPEIWPWEAQAAGAAVVATGRSDFPNQVNNSLSFPGIFRGVLDVRASTITDEMCFAAAEALAEAVGDSLDREHLLPRMMDMEIYPLQAAAVGLKAQEQGIASLKPSRSELLNRAEYMIGLAQSSTDVLMEAHCIPPFPEN